jgi:hypothetical protein
MDLNPVFFGYTNFINAFQVRCTYCLAVEVRDPVQCMHVQRSRYFLKMAPMVDKQYFVFKVPEAWIDDYELFLEGKHSRMSNDAK